MTEEEQEKILKKYEAMVYRQCRKWSSSIWYEDLLQDGKLAIIKAIGNHNPQKASFSTYVWWCIRGALTNALCSYTGYNYYQKQKSKVDYEPPRFYELKDTQMVYQDHTFFEMMEAIDKLKDPYKSMVADRILHNMTLEQMEKKYNLTGERLRKILSEKCKLLKNRLNK